MRSLELMASLLQRLFSKGLLMIIKALIFDFDGLILDTETAMFHSWEEIYDEFGISVSLPEWASLLGSSTDPAEAYEIIEKHTGEPIDRES
ncbi:MAG: HAD family phosphatase, partial [Anaerolineales bacterium]